MGNIQIDKLTTKDNIIYYNGNLFNGIARTQYIDSPHSYFIFEKGYAEEEVVNGVATNVFKEFYKNGQLCKIINVAPGQMFSIKNYISGKFETYYNNGNLCEKGEIFKRDKYNRQLLGSYECYYEDGSAFIKAEFEIDSLVGNGICYYRNGDICQEGDILASEFSRAVEKRVIAIHLAPSGCSALGDTYGIPHTDHFLSHKLYDSGNNAFDFAPYPRLLHNFKSINMDGGVITSIEDNVKESYDKEGRKYLVESCNEILQKHGQSCKYSYGSLTEIESYFNSKLDGVYLKFNYNGFLSEKGYYKDGQKIGKWEYFNNNGVLQDY